MMSGIIAVSLALCSPMLVGADVPKPILASQPWRPKTPGGCRDGACCAEQCRQNGLAASSNSTANGRPSCVGACVMRVSGMSQEDVATACHEAKSPALPGFLQSDDKACPGGPGVAAEAPGTLNACLTGSLLGTESPIEIEAGSAPQRLSPSSFFWTMDDGPGMTGRGFTWYTRIFALFQEGHPLDVQMGMGGTWLKADGLSYDICPCKKGQMGDCCATQSCDCAGWLFESFEGGPGYWGNELPSTVSKWRVGDSVGCYSYYTGSPLFQFGDYDGHPCEQMGLAQLSNQMLMLPDGITFDKEGMIGVGYVHTPLGKVNESDARNFWTIVMDTENFAGPLAYFIPEFWALRPRGYEKETQHLGDYSNCPALSVGGGAFEWNTLETYKASNGDYKIPKMTIPYKDGRSVLMMNNRVFKDDSEIADPIEKALKKGKLDPTTIMPTGTGDPRQCPKNHPGDARFNVEGGTSFSVGMTRTTVEDDECVWSVTVHDTAGATPACKPDGDCALPQYIDKTLQPIKESEAPSELQSQKFREKTSSAKYDQLTDRKRTCLSSPGPASNTLYCTQTLKGGESSTWVGYKWYKFVDQPGLQQAKLSNSEKAFMQERIETMHKMVGRTSRWMTAKQAVHEGLALIDNAALVTPPKGMEHGYVPVALYEGSEKPQGCHAAPPSPSPPPSPPRPTPPAPPPPPPAPTPTTCEGWCLSEGHCCTGTASSFNHPSCAMGCTIAKHTSSVAQCQQKCRDADNTCTWSIAGIDMNNCVNCPSGCDASDGVQECLFGCAHADQASVV